jgi:hypothetical protein
MVLVAQGKAAGVEQQPAPQAAQSRPWLRASAELGGRLRHDLPGFREIAVSNSKFFFEQSWKSN